MSLKTGDHDSIVGYTEAVYKSFGVMSPDDLDKSRFIFLQLISHPGKIIDLGCGCGWFLKYLVDRSVHRIEPFGVDISQEAIDEAKKIFPEYVANFVVGDIQDVPLPGGVDYIVVNPLYLGIDFAEHYARFWSNLNEGGKLLLMITNDTLARMSEWKELWRFLKEKNLKWVQMDPLTYGYIAKNEVLEKEGLQTQFRIRDLLNS